MNHDWIPQAHSFRYQPSLYQLYTAVEQAFIVLPSSSQTKPHTHILFILHVSAERVFVAAIHVCVRATNLCMSVCEWIKYVNRMAILSISWCFTLTVFFPFCVCCDCRCNHNKPAIPPTKKTLCKRNDRGRIFRRKKNPRKKYSIHIDIISVYSGRPSLCLIWLCRCVKIGWFDWIYSHIFCAVAFVRFLKFLPYCWLRGLAGCFLHLQPLYFGYLVVDSFSTRSLCYLLSFRCQPFMINDTLIHFGDTNIRLMMYIIIYKAFRSLEFTICTADDAVNCFAKCWNDVF